MRIAAITFLAVLLIGKTSIAATGNTVVDSLLQQLVRKGVITEGDAKEIESDIKVEGRGVGKAESATQGQLHNSETPREESSKFKLPAEVKIRAQTRFDVGDLLVGSDGRYRTENDLFLRRIRLEVDKELKKPPFGKELALNLTLDADRFDQDFRNGRRRDPSNSVELQYLYADWTWVDAFGLEVGKHKLPFLRVELTSSARQLLVERPAVTSEAKDTFGDYHQPQVMAHGEVAGGALRYYFSYADGANNLDALQDLDSLAESVRRKGWGSAFTGRIEASPLAFITHGAFLEKKKDDTGLGGENHLTLGIDGGLQRGIKYSTSSVDGAELDTRVLSTDLAGRYTFGAMGTITGQLEYVNIRRNFNYREAEEPQGGYLQAGYLLPWILLHGHAEPAVRYEVFDHDRTEREGGSLERTLAVGLNHYLQKHSIKWSYNFVHTRFDRGVAVAANSRNRELHQFMLQLYF